MHSPDVTQFALPEGPVKAVRIEFVTQLICDGLRVGLATTYCEGASRLMKSLGGSWCSAHRMWVYPNTQFREVVIPTLPARVEAWGTHTASDLRQRVELAWRDRLQSRIFTAHLDCQLIPLEAGGFLCQFAYDDVMVRAMHRMGGVWHRPAAGWELKHPLNVVLNALDVDAGVDRDLVFVHDQIISLEELASPPPSEIGITVPGEFPGGTGVGSGQIGTGYVAAFGAPLSTVDVDEAVLADASRKFSLYDFQVAGVRHLLSLSSALLADDMGLGKTRQATVAARLAAGAAKVLVACPASLRINWAREIEAVFPASRVAFIGESDAQCKALADWHIATYERLGAVVRDPDTNYAVFLLDEAHYLKEHVANRTRNAFLLAQRIPRRFLLTGTPVLNRETELHTLLRLSGHAIGNIPLAAFKDQYAGNESRRADLSQRLGEWMLRRSKDVLKTLSGKSHQVCYVMPSLGLASYNAILADASLPSIAKVTKLRQDIERLKMEWLIEALESLPQDAKGLVFCEFLDTVTGLKEALRERGIGCVTLTGADTAAARQRAVDRLQTDDGVRVFIGTTSAAGVGITLTAANYVLFASLPWTPGMKNQAEDRAYRNGQTRHVIVKIPIIPDTIDEQVYTLIQHKAGVADSVISGAGDPEANMVRIAKALTSGRAHASYEPTVTTSRTN